MLNCINWCLMHFSLIFTSFLHTRNQFWTLLFWKKHTTSFCCLLFIFPKKKVKSIPKNSTNSHKMQTSKFTQNAACRSKVFVSRINGYFVNLWKIVDCWLWVLIFFQIQTSYMVWSSSYKGKKLSFTV